MDRLWPVDGAQQVNDEVEAFYTYPEVDRPWLRVNFVSSLDGAVTVGGRSRGLSSPADQRLLALIRDLSDVVLAGVGTALAEGYRGVRRTEARLERRRRFGFSEVPPIAVVTRSCSLPTDAPLLTDTSVPPIVITCEAAPADRRKALAEAGAEIILAGDEDVDLHEAVAALGRRGLRRIGCEGGPTLFGELIEQDLVDELCLSVSPQLAGGDAGRIATGSPIEQPRGMRLLSVLRAEESLLLLRYARMRG